jgi:hypothetical protein
MSIASEYKEAVLALVGGARDFDVEGVGGEGACF